MKKLELRLGKVEEKWSEVIEQWPTYLPPFSELDYALRKNGWLNTIGRNSGCIKLFFFSETNLVGFSLIDVKAPDNGEFYVAVHGDWINKKIGKNICALTLKYGFDIVGLNRIYLKVRTNHKIGIQLYDKMGFKKNGEATEIINDIKTHFYLMELSKIEFNLTSKNLK
jgi:RimJ/RimL family protein N-acetyltransferase